MAQLDRQGYPCEVKEQGEHLVFRMIEKDGPQFPKASVTIPVVNGVGYILQGTDLTGIPDADD